MSNMNILITGSSGTIGTRLCELLQDDYNVIGLDIRRNQWRPALNKKLNIIDLRNSRELDKLTSNIDMVIHLAANARVYELVKNPELALDNILMTFNTLEFMRKMGINKILFASSRETYGNIMKGVAVAEGDVRLENCESPYAASKMTGEALIQAYGRAYGINFVNIRFSNVYGMYDDSDRVVPLWIKQCRKNQDLIVFGKEKSLDFTYIDDAVDGVARIIERFDKVRGNTFNIAYGKEVALYSVAGMIKSLLGSENKINLANNRPGEVWKFEADISKAKELLAFKPEIDVTEGLQRTVKWYSQFGKEGKA